MDESSKEFELLRDVALDVFGFSCFRRNSCNYNSFTIINDKKLNEKLLNKFQKIINSNKYEISFDDYIGLYYYEFFGPF